MCPFMHGDSRWDDVKTGMKRDDVGKCMRAGGVGCHGED